jgi:hypothetical protein
MKDQRHCPFLNRSDARCSDHFGLDDLRFAFTHCFGEYRACPMYSQLLSERRERRSAARETGDGSHFDARRDPEVVQVSVVRRNGKPVSGASRLPAVSGI